MHIDCFLFSSNNIIGSLCIISINMSSRMPFILIKSLKIFIVNKSDFSLSEWNFFHFITFFGLSQYIERHFGFGHDRGRSSVLGYHSFPQRKQIFFDIDIHICVLLMYKKIRDCQSCTTSLTGLISPTAFPISSASGYFACACRT